MDTFKILKPGLLTTVQDLGRFGYQRYGISVAGAMDNFALRVGNLLVGNDEGEAALEMTLLGPEMEVLEEKAIAVTGGDLAPAMSGRPLPLWEAVLVRRGDLLSFKGARSGCRAYLAVAGGVDVPRVMGSKATHIRTGIGGLEGRELRPGDLLKTLPGKPGVFGRRLPPEYLPVYEPSLELRVIMGPQEDYFTPAGMATFLSSEYTVSLRSDRMGYRLSGPPIEHGEGADIISDGIPLGGIQVPADGQPIIMLRDRQTTGGYTKIATVISVDIDRLAQAKPGDKIRFKKITVEEAQEPLKGYEGKIRKLKALLI